MTTLTLKKCSKCGIEKILSDFSKSGKKNNKRSSCKKCDTESHRKWQKNNKELVNKNTKEWRLTNINKFKEITKLSQKKALINLNDSYILGALSKATKYKLHKSDIFNNLIEIKRLQLTLHRLIKEKSVQQSKSV